MTWRAAFHCLFAWRKAAAPCDLQIELAAINRDIEDFIMDMSTRAQALKGRLDTATIAAGKLAADKQNVVDQADADLAGLEGSVGALEKVVAPPPASVVEQRQVDSSAGRVDENGQPIGGGV